MTRLTLVLLFIIGTVALGQNAASLVAPSPNEPATQTEVQKWLATMDAQWQPIFAREVTSPFEAEIARLQQQYLATLDANMAKATSAGNLDLTLVWRNERERFLAAKDMPSTDDEATPVALKAARAAIRARAVRLEKDRATRAKLVHDRYDQVLAQAQTQLTQRQHIDDALAVKTRREEIAKAWLVETTPASATKAETHNIAGTPIPPASTGATTTSSKAKEAFFVGKTWVSPAGTAYTFEPNGEGHTQADQIKWHHAGSGIVQVDLPGKPTVNTRYFKFVSATEAYYNGDKNDITKPVHLK